MVVGGAARSQILLPSPLRINKRVGIKKGEILYIFSIYTQIKRAFTCSPSGVHFFFKIWFRISIPCVCGSLSFWHWMFINTPEIPARPDVNYLYIATGRYII